MSNAPTDPARTAPAAPEELPDEEILDALVQTTFTVTATLNRIAANHGLSLTQLRTLAILRDHAPRIAVLADFLGLEKSTLSGLITRAEQRGLIERRPDPDDARATIVTMTDQGLELAHQLRTEIHESLRPLLDSAALNDQPLIGHADAGREPSA